MIEIAGEGAFIQIDIINFVTDKKWWGAGDFIECNFYYRNSDIVFTARAANIYYHFLQELYVDLKDLLARKKENCFFGDRAHVVALDFMKNKDTLGYLIEFEFCYYDGSDLEFRGNLQSSEEELKKFIQEIEFLL
ncbi:hypothetical protein [Commensalibacter oyaizuii]|uniref:Uncharacterized protein n=1 Tax=Commensalibacter oyaizuii TaxID=3043873 RepID=A0ABT6Q2X1_9PROT|nr:hypothetical protein [Commensalibacter sp. TBRC 16381]MDI2090839.1 hypothetical protein [Commensalibacter sp. TBRC 16381]